MPLEKRPYGRTGEQVTIIGLGGAGLYKHSFTEGVATVHRALELGVNYYDTAPHYGGGMSQPIFGDALRDRPEKYLFAAKIGMLPSSPRFRSYQALRAQLDESLRLLRRDTVDVLQGHDVDAHRWWTDTPPDDSEAPMDPNYEFADAPGMRVLRDARDEGICRYIGITGGRCAGVATVLRNVNVDVCLPAFDYDTLQRDARKDVIPLARDRNVGVILGGIYRVLPIFADIDNWLASPPDGTTPELLDGIKSLRAICHDSGLSLVELTVRYLVADRDVCTILVGAANPGEIEESVAAGEAGPLPADVHTAVEDIGLSQGVRYPRPRRR